MLRHFDKSLDVGDVCMSELLHLSVCKTFSCNETLRSWVFCFSFCCLFSMGCRCGDGAVAVSACDCMCMCVFIIVFLFCLFLVCLVLGGFLFCFLSFQETLWY